MWGRGRAGAREDCAAAMGRCTGYLGGREGVCTGSCQSRVGERLASAQDKPCLEVSADPGAHPRPGRPPARGRGRGRDVTPAPPTVPAHESPACFAQ
jgi:hypothetical protein